MSKIEYKQELPTKPGLYWNKDVTDLPTEHRLMHVIDRNGILMASHYNEGGLLTLGCYGPTTEELAAFLSAHWAVPSITANQIAVGSGGCVRAALADLESYLDQQPS